MFKDMKAYAHLKPGNKGIRRLVEKYGDSLLCVRYRYDAVRGVKLKTVEIVVEERAVGASAGYHDNDLVSVKVPYAETGLLSALKAAGGRWDPELRLWRVRFGAIRGNAGLVERIVRD